MTLPQIPSYSTVYSISQVKQGRKRKILHTYSERFSEAIIPQNKSEKGVCEYSR
jgi:hypothetical protein